MGSVSQGLNSNQAVAKKLAEKFAKIEREETNNWRKLHGKPMRRRGG